MQQPPSSWFCWAVLLLLAGCGGGGGGGGGTPTNPNPNPNPTASMTFTAAGAPASGSVVLRASSTTATRLTLDVVVTDAQDLYGLAFDLAYPGNLISVASHTEGAFFSSGGNPTSYQVAQSTGRLVVGVSRLGVAPGISGSGTVMTLVFASAGTGSGTLAFEATRAVNSSGNEQSWAWLGGQLQVQQ